MAFTLFGQIKPVTRPEITGLYGPALRPSHVIFIFISVLYTKLYAIIEQKIKTFYSKMQRIPLATSDAFFSKKSSITFIYGSCAYARNNVHFNQFKRTEIITVRGQSYVSRLPKC